HDVVDSALDQPIRIGARNYSPALSTVAHRRRRAWRTSMVDLDRKLRSRKIVVSLETQLLHVAKEPIAIEIGIYRRKLICAHIKVEVGPIQPGGRIVLRLWHRWRIKIRYLHIGPNQSLRIAVGKAQQRHPHAERIQIDIASARQWPAMRGHGI